MKRAAAARAIGFLLLTWGVALVTTLGFAEPRGAGRSRAPPHKSVKVDAASPDVDALDGGVLGARPEAAQAQAAALARDAGAVEMRTLDGGARVFRFGEVEIEGRLRSPQLVYFLRRVRAEFAAGDLGHRTFLRELSETRGDPNF